MQHARDVKSPDTSGEQFKEYTSRTSAQVEGAPSPQFRDRTSPTGLLPLSFLFTLGIEICVVSIAVLPTFFSSMVASEGQLIMAYVLTILSAAPLLGILVFETGYIKAFWGHAESRKKMGSQIRALLATLIAASLAIIHPILAAPYIISLLMGGLFSWACSRALQREAAWEFLHQEAVSVLSGRDHEGWRLAQIAPRQHGLIDACLKVTTLLSLTVSVAGSTWLVANEVLNPAAIPTIALLNFWGAESFATVLKQKFVAHGSTSRTVSKVGAYVQRGQVISYELPDTKMAEANDAGLFVNNLSVDTPQGQTLLANVSFSVDPGSAVAVTGNSFSGKTLLMRALAAPHDLGGTDVRGTVRIRGEDPWRLTATDQEVAAAYLPAHSLLIPGSGRQNLACFDQNIDRGNAEKILRQFVFTTDTARQILDAPDARQLSTTELKALEFARLFYLRPKVYLLDRPEDGATPALMSTLAKKIAQEKRYGATFLIATENRELLDLCEKTIVLTAGRLADMGATDEIRKQNKVGWVRLTTQRSLDSETPLNSWLRSQFRRDNDDGNRRNVCVVANELLAFSCQNLSPGEPDGEVRFEMKNFKGHCVLRMIDDDQPLSSGIFEQMKRIAHSSDDIKRIPPLAAAIKGSLSLETGVEGEMRVIEVKIATYDPRLQAATDSIRPTKKTADNTKEANDDTPNGA